MLNETVNLAEIEAMSAIEMAALDHELRVHEFGERLALSVFNKRVYRWAQSMDVRYRHVAHVLGESAGAATWAHWKSWETLADDSEAKGRKFGVHYGQKKTINARRKGNGPNAVWTPLEVPIVEHPWGVSSRTIRRKAEAMAELGVITITNRVHGPGSAHEGTDDNKLITIDFTKTIRNGKVVDHDFMAPLGGEESESVQAGVQAGVQLTKSELGPNSNPPYPPRGETVEETEQSLAESLAARFFPSRGNGTRNAQADVLLAAWLDRHQLSADEAAQALDAYKLSDGRKTVENFITWYEELAEAQNRAQREREQQEAEWAAKQAAAENARQRVEDLNDRYRLGGDVRRRREAVGHITDGTISTDMEIAAYLAYRRTPDRMTDEQHWNNFRIDFPEMVKELETANV